VRRWICWCWIADVHGAGTSRGKEAMAHENRGCAGMMDQWDGCWVAATWKIWRGIASGLFRCDDFVVSCQNPPKRSDIETSRSKILARRRGHLQASVRESAVSGGFRFPVGCCSSGREYGVLCKGLTKRNAQGLWKSP
jgi:hypothetical protein